MLGLGLGINKLNSNNIEPYVSGLKLVDENGNYLFDENSNQLTT